MKTKLTMLEKQKIKTAKHGHKTTKTKHPVLYKNIKDDLIRNLVKSKTPDWGGLRFTVTKTGV